MVYLHHQSNKKRQMETIDLTPTWRNALNIYLMALQHANGKGRAEAIKGLQQMADVADMHVKVTKRAKVVGINLDELLS